MHWPWSELGIAPTQDIVEIKRAYARLLKSTRPDDDAAAYQNLREAYDAALEQARFQARRAAAQAPERAPEAPEDTAVNTAATAPPQAVSEPETLPQDILPQDTSAVPPADDGSVPVEPSPLPLQSASGSEAAVSDAHAWPPPDDGFSGHSNPEPATLQNGEEFELPEFVSPEAIARGVYRFWEEHGDEDLIELWPRVRADLEALPLQLRSEASEWMAALVLDFPELPPGFVRPLALYFGWRDDFRVASLLGAERAQELYEHLHAMGLRGAPNEAERRSLRHLQAMAQWLREGRNWRARLLNVLMPEVSIRRWKHAPVELLEAVDISEHEVEAINGVVRWHHALRGFGLFLACMLLALVFWQDPVIAAAQGLIIVGGVVIALLSSWAYAGMFEQMRTLLPERIKDWHARSPLLGSVLMLGLPAALAAGLAVLPDAGEIMAPLRFFGGWGLALLMPLLVWPEGQRWPLLLLPSSIALTLAMMPLLSEQPPLLLFVLAQVWTLTASVLLSHRTAALMTFYRNPAEWLRPRQVWGWILHVLFFKGVAILVVAGSLLSVPLSLFVSTLRHGPWAGFATLGCAFVIAFGIGFGRGNDIGLLLGLVLAVWLMAVLRWISGRLADRLGGSE